MKNMSETLGIALVFIGLTILCLFVIFGIWFLEPMISAKIIISCLFLSGLGIIILFSNL